jgi:hypothetical protein
VCVTPETTEMVRPTRSSSRKRAASPLPADDGESAASPPAAVSQRAGKRTKSNEPPGLEPIPCAATATATATSAHVHSEAPGVGSGAVASANDTTGHVHGASVGDGAAVLASLAAASSVNVDAACNDGAWAGAIAGAATAPAAIYVAPMLVAPSALNATQQHTAVDRNPTAESGVMAVAGGTKVFAGAAARLAWADRTTSTHTPAGARAGAAAPAASAPPPPSSSSAAASAPPPSSSTSLRGAAESAVAIGATHVLEADKKDVRAGGRPKLEFDAEAYKTALGIVNAGVHGQQWWVVGGGGGGGGDW